MINSIQFREFSLYFIDKYIGTQKINQLNEKNNIIHLVSNIWLNTLIFIINQKRMNNELLGDTPEERYKYFDKVLCKKGTILKEIRERFPKILERNIIYINKYINLYIDVKEKFYFDFKEININFFKNKYKNISKEKLDIIISGDIHNNKAVCIVKYDTNKVVFKNKSSICNQLLSDVVNIINVENKFCDVVPKFMDRGDYFWEEYIYEEPIETKRDVKKYYYHLGNTLAIAYCLNITDLHFENIIANKKCPFFIDVETILGVSPYNIEGYNLATKNILEQNKNSILSTGLLPMAQVDGAFGGDPSGILGGILIKEIRTLFNSFRDDIKLIKKKIKFESNKHRPYYIRNNKKYYFDILNYIDDIFLGFRDVCNEFIEKKVIILRSLESYSSNLKVRILFRNTLEYSVIRQLLVSPIYSEKEDMLFSKLKNESIDYRVLISEFQQLLNMDIPYFYVMSDSVTINDGYNFLYKLKQSPINVLKKQLTSLSHCEVEEQINLIEFSIKSNINLYTNKQYEFLKYKNYFLGRDNLSRGMLALVDKILDSEVYSDSDNSSNWRTLSVDSKDNLELVPMDFSLYKGISGVSLALCEVYTLVDNERKNKIFKVLNRQLKTIREGYMNITDSSYYIGKLGMLSVLLKISKIIDVEVDIDVFEETKIICENIINSKNVDLMSGIAGTIIWIYDYYKDDVDLFIPYLTKMFDIIKSTYINGEDYIYWNNGKNVSLAHGNVGIEVALICLYDILKEKEILELLKKAMKLDKKQLLTTGWYDNRNEKFSANWCHGSTGMLISRIYLINRFPECIISNLLNIEEIKYDIKHAVKNILEIGLDMNNFTLCHGTVGNLLSLYYLNNINCNDDIFSEEVNNIIFRYFCKVHSFGLSNGWMCDFNMKYDSLGLFTGISGILYATAKYMKKDFKIEILLPSI